MGAFAQGDSMIEADKDDLAVLFAASPERDVRVSASAECAFIASLVCLMCAPFTAGRAIAVVAGAIALVFLVVGMAMTSRSYVAGRGLVATGLALTLVGAALVALAYAGFDTAFGDPLLPTLHAWQNDLRTLLRLG